MARMIDLIRQSAVPANLMRLAARGALSVPPAEMLQILVALTQNPNFGQQAQLTLAEWNDGAALTVVSDPQAPPEVLDYFSNPSNLRPPLLPALLENPSVPEAYLLKLATTAHRETITAMVTAMVASQQVLSHPEVVRALLARPELTESESARLQAALEPENEAAEESSAVAGKEEAPPEGMEPELTEYLDKHATEITAEADTPFHLIDSTSEEQAEVTAAAATPDEGSAAPAETPVPKKKCVEAERDRLSPLQKIAQMKVSERVHLAYRGGREERAILIRDGSRVVSSAVLESPRLTDAEVETFAGLKNVGEHILRIIAGKRKFKRMYSLKRILTSNPRCPIDVAMPLAKELLMVDLKNLMQNKNISETVRGFAFKLWKDKKETPR